MTSFSYIATSGMGCAAIALTFAHYFMDLFMDETDPGFTVAKKAAATAAIGSLITSLHTRGQNFDIWRVAKMRKPLKNIIINLTIRLSTSETIVLSK